MERGGLHLFDTQLYDVFGVEHRNAVFETASELPV